MMINYYWTQDNRLAQEMGVVELRNDFSFKNKDANYTPINGKKGVFMNKRTSELVQSNA